MTFTAAVGTLGVLLALLLISALWIGTKPRWQVVFGPPEESRNRIPLTEFYAEAHDRGWDFPADRQLLVDLANGLRDAGLHGSVEMWGRRAGRVALLASKRAPLVRIPADFWKNHEIDGARMALAGAAGEDGQEGFRLETHNNRIGTRALAAREPGFDHSTYNDLHLNYIQVMNWLQTDAESCKGVAAQDGAGKSPARRA